jgi:hypothetical protein
MIPTAIARNAMNGGLPVTVCPPIEDLHRTAGSNPIMSLTLCERSSGKRT